jgi:hypothetical protein
VGWLTVRQFNQPEEAFLEAAAGRLPPGAAFYQVTLDGKPIGTAGITLDTSLTGYRLTETFSIDLAGPGRPSRFVSRSDAILTRSFKLESQTLNLTEAGGNRTLELRRNDSVLTLVQRRPGVPAEPLGPPIPAGLTAPGAVPYRLVAQRGLEPGRSLSQTAISAVHRTMESQVIRVAETSLLAVADSAVWDSTRNEWTPAPAMERPAWRLERTLNGMPVREWVDGQGLLISRAWAFGLALERSPFEINYTAYRAAVRSGRLVPPRNVPGSLLRSSLTGPPETGIHTVTLLVERIDGPAWPGAALAFAGGRQSVAGDTVTIHRESPVDSLSDDPALARATADAGIRAAYSTAMAGLRASPDTLRRLVRWVHRRIRLGSDSLAPVSAARAAQSGIASAEGKVDLMVELARLAGRPARMVSGVDVGRPELPAHVWAEVWTGDRWTAVDPVYGHVPASPTLLRVTTGSAGRPLALVPLIGSLRTTVRSTTR